MVYGLHLAVSFRNTARRDATINNVTTGLASYQLFEEPLVQVTSLRANPNPAMSTSAMFINRADRDALWTSVIAFMGSGTNGPTAGSIGYIWDSTKDEGTNFDVVTDERSW